MRTFSKSRLRGFTLVELMIVVAIIGILAALAIYGVSRYMRNAKTAEARSSLGAMAKGNISKFNNETGGVTVLIPGTSSAFSNQICESATNAVPAGAPAGKKYQSTDVNWNDPADKGPPPKGFACLRFSMDQPQYFSYKYTGVTVAGPTGSTFTASANGDLNGDVMNTSAFNLSGATNAGRVIMAPSIEEISPDE